MHERPDLNALFQEVGHAIYVESDDELGERGHQLYTALNHIEALTAEQELTIRMLLRECGAELHDLPRISRLAIDVRRNAAEPRDRFLAHGACQNITPPYPQNEPGIRTDARGQILLDMFRARYDEQAEAHVAAIVKQRKHLHSADHLTRHFSRRVVMACGHKLDVLDLLETIRREKNPQEYTIMALRAAKNLPYADAISTLSNALPGLTNSPDAAMTVLTLKLALSSV